ncbi:MAG: GNAT family N-acetyltransferase [Dehalococcoidales bacterium]
MTYTVTQESFASLTSYWINLTHCLKWGSVFVLPPWLEVWWRQFQPKAELHLGAVRKQSDIIGIAPLQLKGEKAFFIGGTDVCDYMDFVAAPGMEGHFFDALLDDLRQRGINYLDLRSLRPDSTVITHLVGVARNQGCEVSCHGAGVSVELDLPSTWDEYLGILTGKQRREIRRKLRRLEEMGNIDYHVIEDKAAVHDVMDTFLKLFSGSRQDKAVFMTERRESFFRAMTETMAEVKLLKLGILELGTLPVAMVTCFDYNDGVYLYNSGYDPQYRSLSVGLLSKALCIKDSIGKGRKRFDFLKGAEAYKYHLGGKEIPLYNCQITIKK